MSEDLPSRVAMFQTERVNTHGPPGVKALDAHPATASGESTWSAGGAYLGEAGTSGNNRGKRFPLRPEKSTKVPTKVPTKEPTEKPTRRPVSYTHLTLPTIYSV
eukprot:TRINITY_DN6120_c0_g1_i1.p1 TRINITY_DN6120_c0_g1~~TRINITY_DN6120_c0_g1_i1.p1  ORF type:complete len:104 (-),score=16.28 TRINITY_DN6120_c0_g1_i1:104-415(-)